jgi:hypothetical protein
MKESKCLSRIGKKQTEQPKDFESKRVMKTIVRRQIGKRFQIGTDGPAHNHPERKIVDGLEGQKQKGPLVISGPWSVETLISLISR